MALFGNVDLRLDPVLGYNFLISLLDSSSSLATSQALSALGIAQSIVGGFNECSGLEMNLDTEDYQEGGLNGYVHRFPTRVTWSNITLKKGLTRDDELWKWHYAFTEGKVERRDGMIMLLDSKRVPHTIWFFRRGLPVKYTAPTLNAEQSQVAVESLEVAHEGLKRLATGPAAVLSLIGG